MKKIALCLLLAACGHGAASVGRDDGVCKKAPALSLGVKVPTPGSFVGVMADHKVVYREDVGCRQNAERVLAEVQKLIGPPANRSHRVDGKMEMTYYLWENASVSLGLMISHQGAQWQVTLGFAPVARKV